MVPCLNISKDCYYWDEVSKHGRTRRKKERDVEWMRVIQEMFFLLLLTAAKGKEKQSGRLHSPNFRTWNKNMSVWLTGLGRRRRHVQTSNSSAVRPTHTHTLAHIAQRDQAVREAKISGASQLNKTITTQRRRRRKMKGKDAV